MKHFRKKREEDIEENLLALNVDRAGCKEMDGNWNPKSGQCDLRTEKDKDRPGELVIKKFDRVIRPEDTGGVKQVEDQD